MYGQQTERTCKVFKAIHAMANAKYSTCYLLEY